LRCCASAALTPLTRLQVGSWVTGVKVFAGSKDISKRFMHTGAAHAARLPRSLFKAGENTLLVQAKARGKKPGGASSISIVVPRTSKTLMRMATGVRAAASAVGTS
jgi:hypothetical protein